MDDALKTRARELNNQMLRLCCSVDVCPSIEISGYVPGSDQGRRNVDRVRGQKKS